MTPESIILQRFLFENAFPLWSTRGVDRIHGGFYERFDAEGEILDDPRRARLVGRQIYVFATAEQLGWQGPARAIVRHGLDFLLSHMVKNDVVVPLVDPSGAALSADFDLYDHAFVLFGLAAAAGIGERTDELTRIARCIRDRMNTGGRHPERGFQDSPSPEVLLKANPHMHILEACLAWAALDDDPVWQSIADEIVELCLARFLSRETGALREFFDRDWIALDASDMAAVEPGHQSEWAWLLVRWGRQQNRPDAIAAARRLIEIAEGPGRSEQDLYVNALNPDLSVRDARHRLWPQTERIKSFVALGLISQDEDDESRDRTARAVRGLLRFFDHPVGGAWWEHLDPDGHPTIEPSRASSLYHITCAMQELSIANA